MRLVRHFVSNEDEEKGKSNVISCVLSSRLFWTSDWWNLDSKRKIDRFIYFIYFLEKRSDKKILKQHGKARED